MSPLPAIYAGDRTGRLRRGIRHRGGQLQLVGFAGCNLDAPISPYDIVLGGLPYAIRSTENPSRIRPSHATRNSSELAHNKAAFFAVVLA